MNIVSKNRKSIRKRLQSIYYALAHMQEVITLCHHSDKLHANGHLTGHLSQIFFTGIVCTYARSFTQNEGMSKLAPKFSVFDDSELKVCHDTLVEARNFIFAHSDLDKGPEKMTSMIERENLHKIFLTLKENGDVLWQISRPTLKVSSLKSIISLAEHQLRRLKKESETLYRSFVEGLTFPPGEYKLEDTLVPLSLGETASEPSWHL